MTGFAQALAAALRRRWRLVTVLLVLAAVAGLLVLRANREVPVSVTVAPVERGRVDSTVANTRAGSVTACRRARLAPPIGGRIETLKVREGQRVKAGDVLLTLWNDDLAARERMAHQAAASAAARVAEACTVADTAAATLRRTRALHAQGFVSPEAVEQADGEARARAAACGAARAAQSEARARIDAAGADTARTVLRAPFDGIVAELNGEVGEYLTPSPPGIQTLPAIDLIDDTCLYVSAPIDEVDAARLALGMPARIALDAYRGTHFAGTVQRIAPYVLALEKQARTADVEVRFGTDRPAALLVGYSADVEIVVETRAHALRVPTAAVMPGNAVLVLGADGRLASRGFAPGLSNWAFTEVRSGLQAGEQVVTSLDRAGVAAGAAAVAETPAGAAPAPVR